jgi:spore germination protein YaaH
MWKMQYDQGLTGLEVNTFATQGQPTRWLFAALFSLLTVSGAAAKPTALFYLWIDPNSVRSFLAHSRKIDLLVPTWYEVDQNGLVNGEPDPTVLEVAHNQHLPVMPILGSSTRSSFMHSRSTTLPRNR